MAKRGSGDAWTVLAFIGGVTLLTYFASGKGKNNSPFIPDAIEDQIDGVVEALNNMFGQHWVNVALNYVQSQMALAMPGAAALVNTVHWIERNYRGQPGAIKKQAALQALRA